MQTPLTEVRIETSETYEKVIARFRGHFTKSNHPDSCWSWRGRGKMVFYVGGVRWSPRIFALLAFGNLDARGERLYARCRNLRCVRPEHMKFNGARLYFKAMTENDPPGDDDASAAG
jgi:hypothetical protein